MGIVYQHSTGGGLDKFLVGHGPLSTDGDSRVISTAMPQPLQEHQQLQHERGRDRERNSFVVAAANNNSGDNRGTSPTYLPPFDHIGTAVATPAANATASTTASAPPAPGTGSGSLSVAPMTARTRAALSAITAGGAAAAPAVTMVGMIGGGSVRSPSHSPVENSNGSQSLAQSTVPPSVPPAGSGVSAGLSLGSGAMLLLPLPANASASGGGSGLTVNSVHPTPSTRPRGLTPGMSNEITYLCLYNLK